MTFFILAMTTIGVSYLSSCCSCDSTQATSAINKARKHLLSTKRIERNTPNQAGTVEDLGPLQSFKGKAIQEWLNKIDKADIVTEADVGFHPTNLPGMAEEALPAFLSTAHNHAESSVQMHEDYWSEPTRVSDGHSANEEKTFHFLCKIGVYAKTKNIG